MSPYASPVLPIADQLHARVLAAVSPPAELNAPQRDYQDGKVPPGVASGYVLWGSVREDPGLYYNRAGAEGEYMAHLWGADRRAALVLFTWFAALIHQLPLTLSGHVTEDVTVSLLGIHEGDPNKLERQAEVRIAVRSQTA